MRRSATPVPAALLAAAVLALTGCSALQGLAGGVEPERDETTGEVTEAVEADPFTLRVGDCLNTAGDLTEEVQDVESVPTVPCGEAHDSEIYASDLMTDAEYPGDEAVATAADDFCYAEFEPFVGMAYEDSVLEMSSMFPSQDSWELGDDREILCVVLDTEGGLTATLAGAAY